MILRSPGQPHLTYCTNIHPGETWEEVQGNLERYVLRVKAQVAPDRPFGIGLRLSAQAAEDLSKPDTLRTLVDFLQAHDLYVFTINGFPYGRFHGRRVKESVYLPDWLDERRLAYTNRLAALLADLLPSGPEGGIVEGSISTVPGAFRTRVRGEQDLVCMTDRLLRHVATLHRLHETTGRLVTLALEPEPCCFLETVVETVAFFENRLFSRHAVDGFNSITGMGRGRSEDVLRRHVGVCFDACHMAIEFEEPEDALRAFVRAGIRICKIQISAGLRAYAGGAAPEALTALAEFGDDVYLHQVVERSDGRLTRYVDLPPALQSRSVRRGGPMEWRIHFHVPLFCERLGSLYSTQDFLRTLLGMLQREAMCSHLEVETYTWSVLPEEYRGEDIVASVVRELQWVIEQLAVTQRDSAKN